MIAYDAAPPSIYYLPLFLAADNCDSCPRYCYYNTCCNRTYCGRSFGSPRAFDSSCCLAAYCYMFDVTDRSCCGYMSSICMKLRTNFDLGNHWNILKIEKNAWLNQEIKVALGDMTWHLKLFIFLMEIEKKLIIYWQSKSLFFGKWKVFCCFKSLQRS